jgi:hypothetical protein
MTRSAKNLAADVGQVVPHLELVLQTEGVLDDVGLGVGDLFVDVGEVFETLLELGDLVGVVLFIGVELEVRDLVLELQLLGLQLRGELVLVVELGACSSVLPSTSSCCCRSAVLWSSARWLNRSIWRLMAVLRSIHATSAWYWSTARFFSASPSFASAAARSSVRDYQARLRLGLLAQRRVDLVRLAALHWRAQLPHSRDSAAAARLRSRRRTLSTSSCSLFAPSWATRAK